jgi:hypothetical protein
LINRLFSCKENKKVRNTNSKTINVKVYNVSMGLLNTNYNSNNMKKSFSSNKKNSNNFFKQKIDNPINKVFIGMGKEEAKTIENIFNL